MINLLRELTLVEGISDSERSVRDILFRELKPYTDSIFVNPLGNLIVKKMGSVANGPMVMLTAHIDEVGAQVSSIQKMG
jgi:putative aminopeptidase FrvX